MTTRVPNTDRSPILLRLEYLLLCLQSSELVGSDFPPQFWVFNIR